MSAILKIEKEQGKYAKSIASKLNVSINRKKGMIDMLGVTLFAKFLKKQNINVNLTNCLHKFPFALEEYKIADVSYNGYKIFVVTVFNENYIRIPKMHFKLGIQPDFYVITEVNKTIEKGAVGGFIRTRDVLTSLSDDKFYYPEKKDISKIENLIRVLRVPNRPGKTYGSHLEASSMFVKLADNELSREEKNKLIKHLLTCESCVIKLKDFIQFDSALNFRTKMPQKIINKKENQILKQQKQTAKPATLPIEKKPVPPKIMQQEQSVATESTIDFLKKKIVSKKEAIDLMFKNKTVFDIDFSKINIKDLQKKKRILITTGVSIILFVVFLAGIGIKKTSQALKPIDVYENANYNNPVTDPGFYDEKYSQEYFESHNLDYTLSSATNGRSGVAGVKNLSWEVDSEIAEKENYTKFLQIVGKNIKLSLQNELLLTPDFARNNLVKADIKFSNNGNVGSMKLKQGSGSAEIDDMIQKCVYETFSYIKPPKSGFLEKNLEMTLVIEF